MDMIAGQTVDLLVLIKLYDYHYKAGAVSATALCGLLTDHERHTRETQLVLGREGVG